MEMDSFGFPGAGVEQRRRVTELGVPDQRQFVKFESFFTPLEADIEYRSWELLENFVLCVATARTQISSASSAAYPVLEHRMFNLGTQQNVL